jgi:hypothetical protein
MLSRILAVALLIAGFWCLGQREGVHAQLIGEGVFRKVPGASCSAPTLNGTAYTPTGVHNNPGVLSGLTTTGGNRIIYVVAAINGVNGGADTIAFSDAASLNVLTFSQRAITRAGGNLVVSATAVASGTLTADAITVSVTPGVGVGYIEGLAIGIAGANTTTKFDANGSIPQAVVTGAVSISTSHNCDFILNAMRGGSTPYTPDAGWTSAIQGDFVGMEYLPVTSTQSGLSPTFGISYNGAISDAIVSP